MTPRKRKKVARIGAFDALEDRVVLSAAQNQLIVTDVTSFYSNYVSTVPGLVSAYTSAAAGSTAQAAAASALTNGLTTDVNNLATQLLKDLGNAAAPAIRLSVTGSSAGGTSTVTNTTGTAAGGSLLNVLLAVDAADPAFLGETGGIEMATDVTMGAAVALTQSVVSFPIGSFGTFSQTYFSNVQPLATTLATAQAAASTPPTTDQQTAINNAVSAIDTQTVSDVNTLATNLLTTMPATPSPSAKIRQLVSGSTATTGVTFTGSAGSTANFGSLLAALQAIETDPKLLSDVDTVTGIVSLFAFA
jgi:hypothetical protein